MAHTCRGTINLAGACIDTVDSTNFVVTNGASQVCTTIIIIIIIIIIIVTIVVIDLMVNQKHVLFNYFVW